MKIWTSILVAGAILAFAAPAAYSAFPWDTQSGPGQPTTRIIEPLRPLTEQTATIKALRAENKALAARVVALTTENKALKAMISVNQRAAGSSDVALECASSADPVQTIDYPAGYDWGC